MQTPKESRERRDAFRDCRTGCLWKRKAGCRSLRKARERKESRMQIFHGNIVTSRSWEELAVFRNAYLTVDNGIVEGVYQELPEKFGTVPLTELGSSVLIPAFSDLHVHAPQFSMRGLGMDLLLADWLETHTFPQEARFSSMAYAVPVYEAFVDALIACGTFHACVYGTIHRGATGWLLERMEALGLRAFVGKVNMDLNSPKDLLEPTEESLSETEAFLEAYCGNAFARPILTPRFAPTCSFELLRGLGRLGAKYGVGMQTHIVESRWEAMESVRLNPHCGSDTGIYEKAGLLDNGPVLAGHFIFPTDEDIRILRRCGGIAVQCPDATVNVTAGIMKTAFLQDQGIPVALGSDIGAVHLPGIHTQAARSVQLSKLKWFYEPEENRPLSFANAFHMATRSGGALFGRVGCLEPGYVFDALVIRDLSDPFRPLSPEETVERFCYSGREDDILGRFIGGEAVSPRGERLGGAPDAAPCGSGT